MFRLSQNPSTKTPKPVNSSSSSSSGNNESTVSTTPGIKPSQVYKEQRLSAVLLKRSTSTGSTSTSTGSSTGGRVAGIVGDRSSVAAAFSGETNFSNEEIENVNNVVEESGAGGVSCTSQMSHDSLDKSADKNIYYNDMKAANERRIGDENNSYNDDGDNNDNLEDDEENEEEEEGEEEEEEEEEDDEEEDDYDDEHSTSNLSPIVQVKYNCEYDYDNRKFRLSEGETLFLINKSNEDWWLCLRLAEKLTFFVPASYVKEVAVVPPSSARRLQPPPRPPPPPPPAPSQRASTSSSRQQTPSVIIESPKPQVKKRQHLINNTNTNNDNTTNNNNNSRSRANMDSVYENLAESGSGRPTPSAAAEDYGGLNPDAIISDLDDRLNREEESFVALNKTANIASSTSSGVCVGGPANAGDMLLERRPNLLFPNNTNTVSDLMTLNASLTATSSSSSSSTSGNQSHQQPHMQVVMASAASIEPDYEDEENDEDDSSHIYQNFPFVERKKLPPTTTPTSTTSTFTTEQQRKSAPARIVNAQLSIAKEASVDEKEEEPTTTTNKSDEDDEEEDEDEDEEEEEDDEEEDEDEEKENDAQYLNSKSADDNKPTIYVPKGWKVELTKYKRKCFVNELNGDKWYLNYDQNGNHYFYNANNESVWHLPNVYSQENDDDKSANNTASSSNPNNSNFFKNLIDQELPTFKNLYSRLSTSSKRGNNQTTTVSSDQATTTTKSSLFPARSDLNSTLAATATAASNSYLAADTNSTGISSSSSSGKQTTPSSSNSASRLIAPSTVPLTTVSYSNKPPSDLNFTFKCILLAKGGKKCRKKTSDSYKVSLVSTKILFVKDSKTPKLEFFVDFKGGKCFKVEPLTTNANNSTLTGHKKSSSISNNDVLGSKVGNSSANKEREKALKEKEKERAEILDLVGSNKSALVVETLTGYRILMISENDQVVNDWVYAINSIITQIQSEFSPIYEGPELLHSTQLHEFELNSRPKCSHLPQPPLTPSSDSNTNKKQHKNKELVDFDDYEDEEIYEENDDNQMAEDKSRTVIYQKRHGSNLGSVDLNLADVSNDLKATNISNEAHSELVAATTNKAKQRPLPKVPEKPPPAIPSVHQASNIKPSNSEQHSTTASSNTASGDSGVINTKFSLIMKTLNAFLSRRPPIEQLKKEGIIKECVFGSNLINLCKKEKRNVPSFVDEIIASIESKGLDADGLYRISGNLSEVQKVRYQVDHGKYNFKDFDIHVLCGALKTFFRELEDSLIPFAFHQHFINSTTIQDRSKRFQYVQELLKKLPLAHRETLRNLLRHLLKVIDLSAHNRMNLQNIALVFGPNIMRGNPLNEASTGFNPHIMTQNSIVEYLLAHFKDLYSFQPNSIFTEYSEFM